MTWIDPSFLRSLFPMSFQGDVAGLGLGELLQGLGRGGRDGVLNLYSTSSTVCLGVHHGQIYLLPSPDEDEAVWRQRSSNAWVEDPDHNRESARRQAIARADRLERLYRMIETDNLHFRFDQGAIAHASVNEAPGDSIQLHDESARVGHWGQGMTAEYLLLEHARIEDEANDRAVYGLTPYDLPRTLDQRSHSPQELDFLGHLDGHSTIQEIADRLGLPVTTIRAKLVPYLKANSVRIADHRELLAACQHELEVARSHRAASRLVGWIRTSPAGPPSVGDVELLVGEWDRGRLTHLLPLLPVREARALLNKLDHVHTDKRASRQRWNLLLDQHPTNDLVLLNEVTRRLVDLAEPDASTFQDLLRLARSFQEKGQDGRTRTLLSLAARHLPERPLVRIELGRRMLEVGLEEDGVAWLLDTAVEQLEAEFPDRALLAVRAVLRHDEENEEAHRLTARAHRQIKNRRRRKAGTSIALAVGVVLGAAALVRFQVQRSLDSKLEQVQALVQTPEAALVKFDEFFGTPNPDPSLAQVRAELVRRIESARQERFKIWRRKLVAVEERAESESYGDALEAILQLEFPPDRKESEPFTERQDLFGVVAARFATAADELDVGIDATEEQLALEAQLIEELEGALSFLEEGGAGPEADTFKFGLEELVKSVRTRRQKREEDVLNEATRQKEKNLDILLASARAHAQAGELQDAVEDFDRLFESEPELKSLRPVWEEYEVLVRELSAVNRAVELATGGSHEEARKVLLELGERSHEFKLPFRVVSNPSGARVKLRDGTYKTTPFRHSSKLDERVVLRFELPGYQIREVVLESPADQSVFLYRHPFLHVAEDQSVKGAPLWIDGDYVVVDRGGYVRRISPSGGERWTTKIDTLSGFARSAATLPSAPGTALVVAEDGQTWLVNLEDGTTEGPGKLSSPPVEGPLLTESGASFVLRSGKLAYFESSLQPAMHARDLAPEETTEPRETSPRFLVLVSSATSGLSLEAPSGNWRASIHPDRIRLIGDLADENVERFGDWNFIAWESPDEPDGHPRFWIADDRGLRSFDLTPKERKGR